MEFVAWFCRKLPIAIGGQFRPNAAVQAVSRATRKRTFGPRLAQGGNSTRVHSEQMKCRFILMAFGAL